MNIANPNVIDRETGKLMFLPNSVTQAIGNSAIHPMSEGI
jgi:hypothetical protein